MPLGWFAKGAVAQRDTRSVKNIRSCIAGDARSAKNAGSSVADIVSLKRGMSFRNGWQKNVQ